MAVAELPKQLENELFIEGLGHDPRKPPKISKDQAKEILKIAAKRTNVIPGNNGLGIDPLDIENEPSYVSKYARQLKKEIKPAVDMMKYYFSKIHDAVPYFGNLKIKAENLPTYWGIFLKETRDGFEFVPRIIAKVFGRYSPRKNEITLDPVTLDKNAPEREYMLMKPISAFKAAGHEIYHAVQKYANTLLRYPKPIVEAEAEKAGRIIGVEPLAYKRERAVYEKLFGDRLITSLKNYARDVKEWYIDPIKESLTLGPSPLQPVPAYVSGRRT